MTTPSQHRGARWRLLACLPVAGLVLPASLGAGLRAQDLATHVQRLQAPEAEQREDARRRLARVPRADLPVDGLLARVAAGDAGADAAAHVLALHRDLHDRLRRAADLSRAEPALVTALLPVLAPDDLWRVVSTERAARVGLAERALSELAGRQQLLAPSLVDLLATADAPGPAAFAADLLVHVPYWPAEILQALGAEREARRRVLRALADCPREDLVPWLEGFLSGARLREDPTAALLAIAALPPNKQSPAHARLVLQLVAAEAPAFLPDFAAARFTTRIADGLVAAAHGALLAGKEIGDLLPLLTNVSATGEAHLLALAMTLAPAQREEVFRWLATRDSGVLALHIGQALDGKVELEAALLRRSGPHLTSPARVARVVAALQGDGDAPAAAFDALIEGGHFAPAMLALLDTDRHKRTMRVRELLRLRRGVLPSDLVLRLLADDEPNVRIAAVDYLAAPGLDDRTQELLAARLDSDPRDQVRAACARALTLFGDDAHATAAFAAAFGTGYGGEAVDWLIERPRPSGTALLRARAAAARGQRELDDAESGLVRLGDLAPLPGLLQRVGKLPPRLVKRLIPALGQATEPATVAALQAAAASADIPEQVRELLVEALAARPLAHQDLLQRLYQREEEDGIRLAALRGLLATPAGSTLLAELGAAVGERPLRQRDEDLAFEVLGAASLPLLPEVVEFAARLILVAPLANPVAEAELALSARGAGADYPLVQPLGELIRRDPRRAHGEVLARVLADARAHRNAHALTRRRLGHVLAYLSYAEAAFAAAAPSFARAIVDAPDLDAQWLGPSWLTLARDAEARADAGAAVAAYERAWAGFACHPWPGVQRRRFLPDPDPARGMVPLAALAARPALLRARAAAAAGDVAGAREGLAAARARASADAATLAEIDALAATLSR